MDTTTELLLLPVGSLKPYKNNARTHSPEQIEKLRRSLREYGFINPLLIDRERNVISGHGRLEAAIAEGISEAPCVFVDHLSDAQKRAYVIADNRTALDSGWDVDLLAAELNDLGEFGFDLASVGFDYGELDGYINRKGWENAQKKCGLVKKIAFRRKCGFGYTSFFITGKDGRTLEEIKADESLVPDFAAALCDYVGMALGRLSGNGWCICTTPRRRHKEGFHFATAICEDASARLGIPFYADIVSAGNRDRIHTRFTLVGKPAEKNILLFDDILTTGVTVRDTRQLLTDAGYTVFPVVAIRNQ